MRTLIALPYSPWSEKARWALEHHGVEHRYEEYAPMIGEPLLRLRARRLRGRVSVPVLLDDDRAYTDSFDIARRAEAIGRGAPLFPQRHAAAIESSNRRSEAALAAARALLFDRLSRDDAALMESLPPFVPRALQSPMRPVARVGVRYLARKYRTTAADRDAHARALHEALSSMRADLQNKPYFLGDFSYADIASAVVLQFVAPVDERFIHLGPASREAWTDESLRREFSDLVAWRDDLYARHRRRAPS